MRIVVSKPWGFAAPKIMQGFIDAFIEAGHDVHVMNNQDFFMEKQANEEVRKIIDFKPDFALGYGFSAILCIENTHLFSALKVPTVHYFADDPFHSVTTLGFTKPYGLASVSILGECVIHRHERRVSVMVENTPLYAAGGPGAEHAD